MSGFYITVKNGLLDPKHIKAMGGDRGIGTVWLFLWFLDKMTLIDHDKGEGKVLGGKPITYEEVKEDLGISLATYKRWLVMLRKGGYISTLRTPHGLVITVYKAFKVFGRRVKEEDSWRTGEPSPKKRELDREPSPPPSVSHHPPSGEPSNIRQDSKTITVGQKNTSAPKSAEREKLIADLIYAFREVNPNYKLLFNRKPQREAIARLLDHPEIGGEERLRKIIAYLKISNAHEYAPTITTPIELESRFGRLMAHVMRETKKSLNKGKVAIIT